MHTVGFACVVVKISLANIAYHMKRLSGLSGGSSPDPPGGAKQPWHDDPPDPAEGV